MFVLDVGTFVYCYRDSFVGYGVSDCVGFFV